MSLHTIGIGHVCVTQSDTFRYARLRFDHRQLCSLAMEMEVRDFSAVGPSWLGYYKYQTASHSLRTSVRQKCTCVFLVKCFSNRERVLQLYILGTRSQANQCETPEVAMGVEAIIRVLSFASQILQISLDSAVNDCVHGNMLFTKELALSSFDDVRLAKLALSGFDDVRLAFTVDDLLS